MNETTKFRLENGAVLYYVPEEPDSITGRHFCHIYRVEIKVWGDGWREVLLESVEHENHAGRYIHEKSDIHACAELAEEEFAPGGEHEPNGASPEGLRRNLKSFDKDGEFTGFRGGQKSNSGPVHQKGENGEPLCGAKLTHKKHKPDGRINPYNNVRCSEETVKAVWVPSYAPVTCKKCLKKMESK